MRCTPPQGGAPKTTLARVRQGGALHQGVGPAGALPRVRERIQACHCDASSTPAHQNHMSPETRRARVTPSSGALQWWPGQRAADAASHLRMATRRGRPQHRAICLIDRASLWTRACPQTCMSRSARAGRIRVYRECGIPSLCKQLICASVGGQSAATPNSHSGRRGPAKTAAAALLRSTRSPDQASPHSLGQKPWLHT